ncbi:MAG TPA: DUF4114 domain-containing protein, partial [Oculatellaceae cyanobacterium]
DRDVQLFFALGNAQMDAGIATWEAKRYYNSERPITAIRFLFAGQQVTAWGGSGQGTQVIDGSNWQPYQALNVVTPNFPEHTSGHSAFSAAGAEILKRFTGSDAFGLSATIPAGTSRIEAGVTPATDITLSWATFSEAADQAGMSREYGGIHFQNGNLQGRELGREVGAAVWEESQQYIQAGLAAPPSLTATANNLLTIQGSGIPTQVKCTLTDTDVSLVNEVGVFVVDDDQGTINGIAPGSAGYLEAALSRGQVIFSALSDLPDGFTDVGQTRQLSLPTNKPLMFYLVQNSTTDSVLANGANGANVFFASSSANSDGLNHLQVSNQGNGVFNLAWEDKLGGTDQDFNDMKLNVQLTNPSSLNDWMGVRQGEQEVLDLSLQTGLVSGNFIVNEEAAFDNTFGLYRVADLSGGIDVDGDNRIDLRPGDADYAKVAVERRVDFGSGLPGGGFLAPFLIANGTPEQFLAQNSSNQQGGFPLAYFSFLGANSDGVDHVRLLADNTFGFEDKFGGGDLDCNDLVVKVAFT